MKAAFGLDRPENVVKLTETRVWIIEAKAARRQLSQALDEAIDCYAEKINGLAGQTTAILATGVAGNEDAGYLARTMVRVNGRWKPVTINHQEATGLLSPKDARVLLETGGSDIHEYTPPQWLFANAAERINEFLHSGGINKNDRARTMAALLLSVIDKPPDLDTSLTVLIGDINNRSEEQLRKHNKPEFAPFVCTACGF